MITTGHPIPLIRPCVRFTRDEAQQAAEEWHLSCGPAAVAALLGLTLPQVRPHLGTFEAKGYMSPTMMYAALRSLGVPWTMGTTGCWPVYGLARIQWHGPWMQPKVPIKARYRYTHWVGCDAGDGDIQVFDINALCAGGWVPMAEWMDEIVPWILREAVPRADGTWAITHALNLMGHDPGGAS
jgi:hypothetical protein